MHELTLIGKFNFIGFWPSPLAVQAWIMQNQAPKSQGNVFDVAFG